MLFEIKAYIKFLFRSQNEHGVHSPFVFSLITKCFYDKEEYPEYFILKNYRKELLKNKNTIEVTDFGVGSKIFKSNKRAINEIAKNAGISFERAKLLFRITDYFQPETILEVGTSLGLATAALALGNKIGTVTTLEGCGETLTTAKKYLEKFNLNNVVTVQTEFSFYLKKWQPIIGNPQLIYFDGNHSKRATLDYFELLLHTISNESIWIFDDIHWSLEMQEAWEIIKNHPKVKVTIDTFQWGLVIFRQEQPKEHFVVRI